MKKRTRSGTRIPHADRKGDRVELYMPTALRKRIDAARGVTPRSVWLIEAAEAKMVS